MSGVEKKINNKRHSVFESIVSRLDRIRLSLSPPSKQIHNSPSKLNTYLNFLSQREVCTPLSFPRLLPQEMLFSRGAARRCIARARSSFFSHPLRSPSTITDCSIVHTAAATHCNAREWNPSDR